MASDSRYIYYAPQDVQNPHPYPPYPAYDAPPQYPPNQARPIRNGVPQPSHSPVQSQPPPNYPPPPNGYPHPGAYVAQAYGPPPPAHWSPDAWQHFPQSFVQASPPIQEQQQYASEARPDVQPQAPPEQRAPADNAPRPASTQPGSSDAQMSPPMALAPPPKPRSAREAHQPPPLAPALSALPLSLPLDFVKLMDSYRLVIDSATALAGDPGQSRHASIAEDVDRMLQAAAFGAQALDAAVQRAAEAPPAPPSSDPPAPPEEGDGSGGKPRQQKPDAPQEGGQHCLGCKATSTPEWRRGPLGPRTLCNACGLVYAKLVKKRTREPGRARNGAHAKQPRAGLPDALSSGEDGSDRASQGRRSEVPDEGQM